MQSEYCEFPEDALYDLENNVWIRLNNGVATLGITSVHAALAGKLHKVNFKAVGSALRKGQSVATIESVKYFGVVRAPLSGTLIEKNASVEQQPKLANDSPYELGWFVRIKPSALLEERSLLSDLKDEEEKIKAEIGKLGVRCFKAYPDYELSEIGVECAAVLVRLNDLIERIRVNEIIHVVSDDPTADIEMERWADQTGQVLLESRREGRLVHFIVKKVK